MSVPRIVHVLLIVVISMPLWGLPYGLLVAALVRLLFELGRAQWRMMPGSELRVG